MDVNLVNSVLVTNPKFLYWFCQVQVQHTIDPSGIIDDLYALACSPNPWVASYATCIVNRKRFHTKNRE